MAETPVYQTNIEQGFRNGADDIVTINESDVIHKYYGSNSTVLGLSEAIVPRAFSSITGPIYLRPGYSTLLYAMEYSKTLPALKEEGKEYVFYAQSDESFAEDSALFINWIDIDANRYKFNAYDRATERFSTISRNHLTKMILNHVGTSLPRGSANREFIENLAGNYIVVNNLDNSANGGLPNYWGYNGDSAVEKYPVQLEEETDNGKTYDVMGWFTIPTSDMYARIISYPHFYNLIIEAGLFNPIYYTFPFLTEGEIYTVFIPTEEALAAYDTDSLSTEELQQFIKYHFSRGTKIWTDGSGSSGYYETLRVDESSTQYSKKYSTLNIETGIDIIRILDANGNLYTEITEQEGVTNIMIATDMDEESNSRYDFTTTGVIHEIDRVLIKQ